ncbi:adenosylcobinamide-GDP ribazoletransferase [Cohnella luojiensis]|uniref:Adenosylcobinamide-GDP ribazoletransferase n=1 Tax=Cohnella luojiensis TaxID=652876 RepID=A0A4Y8LN87_9BACL|nr:adenosylcobinamide-GDP ribazoletransferase [Cohnella luojiensis]TFE19730.1 adenosylcobinamide-GDP ribazoletransferase [Cohnella luojiensis]
MRSLRMVIIGWLQAFAAAVKFLTRIPLPVTIPYTDAHFRRSVVFYPYVGLLIGLIVTVAGFLLDPVFPASVSGILLVALWTLLSGALHLDGLMDTADGLLSHRSRERMLEIMKDSRVGAMGVIVCVFYIGLKIALTISLLEDRREEGLMLLMLIPVWSRNFMVTAIAGWPYARKEQGLGSLYRSARMKHAVISGLGAILLSAAILFLIFGWTGTAGLVILSFAFVSYGIGFAMAAAISRKLGGLTGDVYGALNECIELGLLLALVSYLYNVG